MVMPTLLQGQTPAMTGALTGSIKDPAGYLIPHAQITLIPVTTATVEATSAIHATSNDAGVFTISHLAQGSYSLLAQAAGFALVQQNVLISASSSDDHPQRLDLVLPIPVAEMQVEVPDDGDATSVERNGSALMLRPADLVTFSDDPDTMKRQLEAIAGPSPDGAHLFIDGFEGTRLPPKSNIREVRINSNLYSAQYDTPGQARVEIFTKPGTGALHGGLFGNIGKSVFNAQDPIAPQPAYSSDSFGGYVNGPLGKHLTTMADVYRFARSDSSVIRATTLDGKLNPITFTQAIPNLRVQIYADPRIDFQAPFHTSVSLRYVYSHDTQAQGGIGGLALATQSYRLVNTNQILQLLATNSFGAKSVNELRFQYTRTRNNQFASSNDATVDVQGGFKGGGAPGGTNRDNLDTYEMQDYFSHVFKKSFLRAGGRLRTLRDANFSNAGFNGAYIFPTLAAYRLTLQGIAQGLTPAQIRASGGGPTLFSRTAGFPSATVSRTDGALYAEDDWKITSKFTTTFGARLESQNVISDHLDFAPRVSVAYALGPKGKPARFTFRAGAGIFYQRFSTGSQLRIARGDGLLEQQYLVQNPYSYPTLPTLASLGASVASAITQRSPDLRAPYSVYSGAGIDHPFGKVGSISVSYSSTHLVHAFETRNINAPLPGTYNPEIPTSGIRPYGGTKAIYEYGSEGVSNQQTLRINGSIRRGPIGLSAYYYYMFNNANTDGGFPSNSYDQHADYGRSANDIRHQLYSHLIAELPLKIHSSTDMMARAGTPFSITVGQDLNGDTIYKDRPTYATDLTRASVVHTRWGTFDTQPIAGQTTIPVNLGTNPIIFQIDERISRAFQFGPHPHTPVVPLSERATAQVKSAPIPRRYTIEFNVYAMNVLNYATYTNVNGVLNSPLFGQPTANEGARSFTFGASFNF